MAGDDWYSDDDEEPDPCLLRYEAELAPEAKNDYLAMAPSKTKRAFLDLFQGADPAKVQERLEVEVEDARVEESEGWFGLRVGGYMACYLRLSPDQRHELHNATADILVLRIRKIRP